MSVSEQINALGQRLVERHPNGGRLSISPRTGLVVFCAAMAAGVVGRVALASLGHNHDPGAYEHVVTIARQGGNVYADTDRYPYAPGWLCFLLLLKQIQLLLGLDGPEAYHIVIAAFLSLVDGVMATILGWRYGLVAALLFILSPIGLLITGYHSQFDNFAILIGLCAWILVVDERTPGRTRNVLLSAVLLGLSLTTKHLLLVMPLWVLFWPRIGPLRLRVLYCAIAYGIFGLSFAPWLIDERSRAGVIAHVFQYNSRRTGLPVFLIQHLTAVTDAGWQALKWLWLGMLAALGWLTARRWEREGIFLYLVAFTGFAPSVADQYLAIPLIACAYYASSRLLWCYQVVGVVLLFFSIDNINGPNARALIWDNVSNPHLASMLDNVTVNATAQVFPAVFLLVAVFLGHSKLGPGRVSAPE